MASPSMADGALSCPNPERLYTDSCSASQAVTPSATAEEPFGADSATQHLQRCCSGCSSKKPKSAFSKKQWRRPKPLSRCTDCIGATLQLKGGPVHALAVRAVPVCHRSVLVAGGRAGGRMDGRPDGWAAVAVRSCARSHSPLCEDVCTSAQTRR